MAPSPGSAGTAAGAAELQAVLNATAASQVPAPPPASTFSPMFSPVVPSSAVGSANCTVSFTASAGPIVVDNSPRQTVRMTVLWGDGQFDEFYVRQGTAVQLSHQYTSGDGAIFSEPEGLYNTRYFHEVQVTVNNLDPYHMTLYNGGLFITHVMANPLPPPGDGS